MYQGRGHRLPPLHPDLCQPVAVHVDGDGVGPLRPQFGIRARARVLRLTCGSNPDFWLDYDAAHARVISGHLGPGYAVHFPTGRWSVARVSHADWPRFWIAMRVFT